MPDDTAALLADAELVVLGQVANASNGTLLVQVGEEESGVWGVYKPRRGERPLWDFPRGTLCQREVAAFAVSAFLGWDVVPLTVLRDGPFGEGSLQLFVAHDPRRHYFVLVEDEAHHADLARLALFDLLVNNADRKGSHVLLGHDGRIRACDHGLTFHVEPKVRTVIWEFGGYRVPERWREDLERLAVALATSHDVSRVLSALLAGAELEALRSRAAQLSRLAALPEVGEDFRAYPWPLL